MDLERRFGEIWRRRSEERRNMRERRERAGRDMRERRESEVDSAATRTS